MRAAPAAAVLALAAGCAAAGAADGPPPPDRPVVVAARETAVLAAPPPAPSDHPDIPVSPATAPAPEPSPVPERVEYAALGADLTVVPVGVADDGQMEIPEDAATAGWYRFGRSPADDEGTTVVAAHVGSRSTPVGPLRALRDARPGDEIVVRDSAGTRHLYRVSGIEQVGKDGLDLSPFFERSGPERLVLVTCGGEWLPERSSYADNIIVVAEPAAPQ